MRTRVEAEALWGGRDATLSQASLFAANTLTQETLQKPSKATRKSANQSEKRTALDRFLETGKATRSSNEHSASKRANSRTSRKRRTPRANAQPAESYRRNLVSRLASDLLQPSVQGGLHLYVTLNPQRGLADHALRSKARAFLAGAKHIGAHGFVQLEDRDKYRRRRKLHAHGVIWLPSTDPIAALDNCYALARDVGDLTRNHFRLVDGQPGSRRPEVDLVRQLTGPSGVVDYAVKNANPRTEKDRLMETRTIKPRAVQPKPRPAPKPKQATCEHCGLKFACERPNRARYHNASCRKAAQRQRAATTTRGIVTGAVDAAASPTRSDSVSNALAAKPSQCDGVTRRASRAAGE